MDQWLASESVPGGPPIWATMPQEVLAAAQDVAGNGRYGSIPWMEGDEAGGGDTQKHSEFIIENAKRQVGFPFLLYTLPARQQAHGDSSCIGDMSCGCYKDCH